MIILPGHRRPRMGTGAPIGGGGSGGGGSDAEPTFGAGQTMVINETFDGYASYSDAFNGTYRWFQGAMSPSSGNDTLGGSLANAPGTYPAGANQIITGLGGTGKAYRLVYVGNGGGGAQEGHSIHTDYLANDPLLGKPGHAMYTSYLCRFAGTGYTIDSDSSHPICIKFLEQYYATSSRMQYSLANQYCYNLPFSYTGTVWNFFGDAGVNTSCQAGQTSGPWPYSLDNQVFRVTTKSMTNSASGARDGCGKMWINGTLVIAVDAAHAGVHNPNALTNALNNGAATGVTGANAHWCENADVDGIRNDEHFAAMTFGGVNGGAYQNAWTFDIDTLTLWRD